MRIVTALLAVVLLAAPAAQAEIVHVTVRGTVEYSQVNFGIFAGVGPGDAVSYEFDVDSDVYLDSATYNTRGYEIIHSSFALTIGGVSTGLQDPFPAGDTPYFVIRESDPVADGFFFSRGVDWPDPLPTNEPGGIDPYFGARFEVGYDGSTVHSLDILAAAGTHDYTGLTSFYFTLADSWADPIGFEFVEMTIEPMTTAVESTPWSRLKSLYR